MTSKSASPLTRDDFSDFTCSQSNTVSALKLETSGSGEFGQPNAPWHVLERKTGDPSDYSGSVGNNHTCVLDSFVIELIARPFQCHNGQVAFVHA